ncbi:hypothetical protein IQ06DRAFT_372147 [Phaeosphaeriaceae sp. SRC1lsM3a]|nr:hypothetical protein IQ06DRAFT_372147 [Stagonospora sp. SRC1lsM3a]
MRGRAKTTVPPLQQADFDALPDSVQRKYFSSLERLQIRQHSLDDHHASAAERSLSSRASSSTPLRPSLNLNLHRSQHRRSSSRGDDAPPAPPASHAELDFFCALPEKLRKLHYSRDEQAVLLAKCEQAFLPPDHFPQHYPHHRRPDLERAQQRFSDFHFGFQKDPYPPLDSDYEAPPRPCSPSESDESSVSPRQASFPLAAQEKDHDAESSLFYLDIMGSPASRRSHHAPPVRRTMSLNASSMQYSSSSAVLMGAAPGFSIAPSPVHQRAHSSSFSLQRSSHTPTPPVFDPEATHYRDPEARKKLRTYLASPQKFDEAIEFGFPSTATDESVAPHYQLPPITSHSRKFSRDMQTFLRDGKLSFFEDVGGDNQGLESDRDSVPDMESPTTPSSTGQSFRLHSRQVSHSKFFTSDESSPLSPLHPGAGHLNREMTLRMTLTRPDLRADDDQLYGWQASSPKPVKDDPLALEELVFSDDMTGTKGAFYVKPKPRGNLVTRMLKRASLKGR